MREVSQTGDDSIFASETASCDKSTEISFILPSSWIRPLGSPSVCSAAIDLMKIKTSICMQALIVQSGLLWISVEGFTIDQRVCNETFLSYRNVSILTSYSTHIQSVTSSLFRQDDDHYMHASCHQTIVGNQQKLSFSPTFYFSTFLMFCAALKDMFLNICTLVKKSLFLFQTHSHILWIWKELLIRKC